MSNTAQASVKERQWDPDFLWGKLPAQDNSGQFTRSMMEMRKPKPYELTEPPLLGNRGKSPSPFEEVEIPTCPITAHTIKLLKYVRQVRPLISKFGNKNLEDSEWDQLDDLALELPSPPQFDADSEDISSRRRSRSSSSGKSKDDGNGSRKLLFSAPDTSTKFRCGLKQARYPNFDNEAVSRLLKKSVATVAAHTGYEEATTSSLEVLAGVAEAFIISFTKALRDAADLEAQEGKTAFFDCLDQALHESGNTNLKKLHEFWNKSIVLRHKSLQRQAEKVSATLKSIKYPKKAGETANIRRSATQTRTTGFSAAYGKWTPVTGMSSTPLSTSIADSESASTSGTWGRQSGKYSIKSEPYDSNILALSTNYGFSTVHSDAIRVKSENGGLEFPTRSPTIELLNTEAVLDESKSYVLDDCRPVKKQRIS